MSELTPQNDSVLQIEYTQETSYETIPFKDESFPIRVLLNKESRVPDPLTWHEQIEIIYILEGNLICVCNFKHFLCEPGDIIIVNPCEVHAVFPFEKPARFHCLIIDPRMCGGRDDIGVRKYIDPYTERKARFNHLPSKENIARIRPILDELVAEYKALQPGYELAIRGNLLRLFSLLYRYELSARPVPKKSGHYESILPALHYIAANYTRELTLADLASQCCMNRSYFSRQFHEITGKTAIAYVNEYRLAKAKALLLTTTQSISDVAAATGFADSSYFTRKFKALYGISPSAMRRPEHTAPDEGSCSPEM